MILEVLAQSCGEIAMVASLRKRPMWRRCLYGAVLLAFTGILAGSWL
ncbi:MAG TPA: hypothetical protein VF774_12190 [Pseudoduganella sp.]|jgi:hypothetical protein